MALAFKEQKKVLQYCPWISDDISYVDRPSVWFDSATCLSTFESELFFSEDVLFSCKFDSATPLSSTSFVAFNLLKSSLMQFGHGALK